MTSDIVLNKLRLQHGQKILVMNAPAEFVALLKEIEFDSKPSAKKTGTYDFVQIFATHQAELEKLALATKGLGKYDCLYWACYPKGTGSIKSDIKRETVWKALEIAGLQAVTQVAIDNTWSALRGRPTEMIGK